MTPQEAIERIDLLIGTEKLFIKISTMGEISHSQNIEALEMAKKAVEKQIAKKPADYDGKIKSGLCPDCESVVTSDFCDNCGQALDWSDN